ncbi:MAG: AraC family transcriptional regulator [Planctomycetota bacterium]
MAAPRAYEMLEFTYFDMVGEGDRLPAPFYLGLGKAFSDDYRSERHAAMPGFGVVKISLSEGGVIRVGQRGDSRLAPGEATLRTVGEQEVNDGYDPAHHGAWEFLGIMFHGAAALEMLHGLQNRFGHRYPLSVNDTVVRQLSQMARQPSHNLPMTAVEGMKLINDLMLALGRAAEKTGANQVRMSLVQSVERTIQDNLDRDLTIEELAEAHEVSREHLTRQFRRELGVSPHHYIAEKRVREACQLLQYSNLTIAQVIANLGFASRQTFYRTFRRVVGKTPSEYRRAIENPGSAHFADEAVLRRG